MKPQSASRSKQDDQKRAQTQERFFTAHPQLQEFFTVDKDANKSRRKRGRAVPDILTSTK